MRKVYSRAKGSKAQREKFRKKQLVKAYLNHFSKEDIIDNYLTVIPAGELNEIFTDAVKYINSGAIVP